MIPFTMPLLIKALYPLLVVVVGFALARSIERLDERSLAAACLFAFMPVFVFSQSHEQPFRDSNFVFILFFMLFHTAALFLIVSQILYWFKMPARNRHLYLLNILLVSIFSLQGVQPSIGAPAQAVQAVSILLFFHLVLLTLVGIYLSADHPLVMQNLLSVAKSPLLYALILGLAFAPYEMSSFEILTVIDSLVDTALHLSLLITGLVLGRYVFFLQAGEYTVLLGGVGFCVLFRLIVSPALAVAITWLMGIDDIALQRAMILASGAPSGVLAVVLMSFYGRSNEKRFTVLNILISTLLSFLTLPLLVKLVDKWFPLA